MGHTYKEHASLHLPGSPPRDLSRTTGISEQSAHLNIFDLACLCCVGTLLGDRPARTRPRPSRSMNNASPRGSPARGCDLIPAVLTACPILPWPHTRGGMHQSHDSSAANATVSPLISPHGGVNTRQTRRRVNRIRSWCLYRPAQVRSKAPPPSIRPPRSSNQSSASSADLTPCEKYAFHPSGEEKTRGW